MKQLLSRIPSRILTLIVGFVLSVGVYAQTIDVNGVVRDASGLEIPGAHVRIQGKEGGGDCHRP